jgi:hypothetical protein
MIEDVFQATLLGGRRGQPHLNRTSNLSFFSACMYLYICKAWLGTMVGHPLTKFKAVTLWLRDCRDARCHWHSPAAGERNPTSGPTVKQLYIHYSKS